MQKIINVETQDAWMRMDRLIEKNLKPEFSRNEIQKWIRDEQVRVNGIVIKKPSHKLNAFDVIEVSIQIKVIQPIVSENISIQIVYEEDEFLVVHKPVGLTVHPGAGNTSGTLANALLGMGLTLSDIGGGHRPGIVHRLDKETSGALLIAKTNRMHRLLSDMFQKRQIHKEYRALVEGKMGRFEDRIDMPIGRHASQRTKMAVRLDGNGRQAVTDYRVLEEMPRTSLLAVKLITGRTHQIRVHMKEIGHSVLGDTVYGKRHASRLMLHAYQIAFEHPLTNKNVQFTCELEDDFTQILNYEREVKLK